MITIDQQGRRYYLRGNTYPIKRQLREAGCTWDPEARAWWTGKRDVAERFAKVDPADVRETIGDDAPVLGARVQYKRKLYFALCNRNGELIRSRTDKHKLCSRDGQLVFWAPIDQIRFVKYYRRPQSFATLRAYAEERREEQRTGECRCSCHDEPNAGRPGSTLYDGCDRCGHEACC